MTSARRLCPACGKLITDRQTTCSLACRLRAHRARKAGRPITRKAPAAPAAPDVWSRQQILTADKVRDTVACPTCDAAIGAPCAKRPSTSCHLERWNAVLAQRAAEAEPDLIEPGWPK